MSIAQRDIVVDTGHVKISHQCFGTCQNVQIRYPSTSKSHIGVDQYLQKITQYLTLQL